MSTYQSLPKPVEGETTEERIRKLFIWLDSMDGALYSVDAAIHEVRKELLDLRKGRK